MGRTATAPFVIEGLLAAPSFYDALRNGDIVDHLRDCDTCQAEHSAASREGIGCGWLPLVDGAQPMTPAGYPDDARPLTTCPGYTVRLPQVSEARRARHHAEIGTLRDCYGGEPLTEVLLTALELADAAQNALTDHKMKKKAD